MTEGINHTRMVAFRACRRRHKLAYYDRVRAIKKTLSLMFGDAWHVWLENWLGWSSPPVWIPPMPAHGAEDCETDYTTWSSIEQPCTWRSVALLEARDPYEAARFRAMVLAYHLRWRKQDWAIRGIEQKYETPLINPETEEASELYHRDGRIDAMIEILSGDDEGQWLVEHKSHEGPLKPGDTYFLKLRTDSQLTHYWIGAKALGYEPRGIIYDVACKPSLDPMKATPVEDRKFTKGTHCSDCATVQHQKGRKGTGKILTVAHSPTGRSITDAPCPTCHGTGWSDPPRLYANQRDRDETIGEFGMRCFQEMVAKPDAYFHRVKVARLDHEMREYEISDWQTVESMRIERELGYYPMNTDMCWQRWGYCDYLPICQGSNTSDDTALYTIRGPKDERAGSKTG